MQPVRLLAATLAAILLAGCPTPSFVTAREPGNLALQKQALVAYVDSGAYERDLTAAADAARHWIEQRAGQAGGERLAVVFDLDETLLNNFAHMRRTDFGYVPALWDEWVAAADAPAIAPVAAVCRAARARGLAVFYVTGRREKTRPATLANLRRAGLADFTALHCKGDDDQGTTQAFKTAVRRQLTADGYTIIANIGDQRSDLDGGFAERTFKLPNPFYLTK